MASMELLAGQVRRHRALVYRLTSVGSLPVERCGPDHLTDGEGVQDPNMYDQTAKERCLSGSKETWDKYHLWLLPVLLSLP